jgi:hypothetical protein
LSYTPTEAPQEYTPEWINHELQRLQQELKASQAESIFKILYAEPARMYAGMVVYADGTTWNPGAGEGLYRRNKANAAWVSLG